MNNLPPELLLLIISTLDHKSILNFSETNKKHRKLSQRNFDKNFVIHIDFKNLSWSRLLKYKYKSSTKDFNILLKCKRKFTNFHIQGLNERTIANNRFLEVFKKFSVNIKTLCLKRNCELALIDLIRILQLTPNIESLILNSFKEIGHLNFEFYYLPRLLKLKSIKLEWCKISFSYPFFKNYQFDKIMLFEEGHDLGDLLTSQQNLKVLILGSPWIFCQDFSSQIKFKLRKLSICCETTKDYVNVCKFLKTQPLLKELELPAIYGNNSRLKDEILELIFGLKLTHLTLYLSNYTYNSSIFCLQNTSLKELNCTIHANQDEDDLTEKLLEVYPNIQTLKLRKQTVEAPLIYFISENLRHLKDLLLSNCPADKMRELKCHNLKKITFEQCELFSVGDWSQFAENNSHITDIKLDVCFECLTDEIVELLAIKWPMIEHFEIEGCYNKGLTLNAETTIIEKCRNIKYVRLVKQNDLKFSLLNSKVEVYGNRKKKRVLLLGAAILILLYILILIIDFLLM